MSDSQAVHKSLLPFAAGVAATGFVWALTSNGFKKQQGVSEPKASSAKDKAEKTAAQSPARTPTRKGSFLLNATPDRGSLAQDAKLRNGASAATLSNSLNRQIGMELIKQRDQQMGPNVSVFYKDDGGLVVTRGRGCYMRDLDGNLHLDCCNNVASCGHAHPAVVEAGCKELSAVQTNARFLHPTRQRYLKKLLATFPPELNTVYLVNSGSEANDLALRIAREHATCARKADVIVLDNAYHGHTQALVDISPYKWYQATNGIDYQGEHCHVAPMPDTYRGKHRGAFEDPAVCALYVEEVKDILQRTGGVGTFIAESIIGCGGQVVPPPGYLQGCYDAVRAAGGVCIADEVQTGFARSGTHFWAFQRHGVVPDIVTCGKPMGNGYPIAAVICRRELAQSFSATGIEYFNTYGGNSVGCAIAEAVIDTIAAEGLQRHALEVGDYLTESLQRLRTFSWVGDVRGFGLFQGLEFVLDSAAADPQPHPTLTKFVVDFLRYENVVISRDGPDENVIKVKPPLLFSRANVDTLVGAIEKALVEARRLQTF